MQHLARASGASERDNSISSSGVAISPVTVETTMGKNAIKNVITTRGRSDAPSVTTMIGATATIGVDWTMTRMG
jgi:hypothetical protein